MTVSMRSALRVFPSDDEWRGGAVTLIAETIRHALDDRGTCIVGLSGGSTPGSVYEQLATERIDWSNICIFLTDERCVPPTHAESNQRLVRETLLSRTATPAAVLFPDTSLAPDACADVYDDELRALLGGRGPDVLVLGLGVDGHTASLFPPVDIAAAGERFAIRTHTDRFAIEDRISITPRVIETSSFPLFLLKGQEKKAIWEAMTAASGDPRRWPGHAAFKEGKAVALARW